MSEQNRVIGGWGAIAIVAGSMLGIGIFLTPAMVANQTGSVWGYLAFWLLGGLMAFAGATCYAELGSRFPQAGGDYVFVREAFGESAAFATGLLLLAGVFVGSIATMSVAVATYQIGSLLGVEWGVTAPAWGPKAIGIAIIAALTLVNIIGVRLATALQLVVTLIPVLLFSVVSVYALGALGLATSSSIETGSARGFASAMTAVYFAYAGWNAVAYVGGEVKNPARNVPLGLVGGTVFVTLVYLLMNFGFLAALGLDGVRQAFEVGTATASLLGGDALKSGALVLIVLALLGSVNATILGGARIAFALAEDEVLPPILRDSSDQSPRIALTLQGVAATFLVLSGTFESLLAMTSIAMLLIASLAVLALVKFRKASKPEFGALLYPVTPIFFVLSSAAIMAFSIWEILDPVAEINDPVQHYLPLVGLVMFLGAYLGHRAFWKPSTSD